MATVARASRLERLEACAALAEGRVAAVEGNERAVGQLKCAVDLFAPLELPLDAARAQLELARTLAASAPAAAVREGKLALGPSSDSVRYPTPTQRPVCCAGSV